MAPEPKKKDKFAQFNTEGAIPPAAPITQLVPSQAGGKFAQFDTFQGFKTPEIAAEYKKAEDEGQKTLGQQTRRIALPLGLAAITAATLGTASPLTIPATGAAMALGGVANEAMDIEDAGVQMTPGESVTKGLISAAIHGATSFGAAKLNQAIPYQGTPLKDYLYRALMNSVAGTAVRRGMEATGMQEPSQTPTRDFATDFGLNLVLPPIAGVAHKGVSKLVGPKAPVSNPGSPLGLELNKLREDIGQVGPRQSNDQFHTEEGATSGVAPKSRQEYGVEGQQTWRGNLKTSQATKNKLYEIWRKDHIEPNSETVQKVTGYTHEDGPGGETVIKPIVKDAKIRGVIMTADSAPLAKEALEGVDVFIKGEDYQILPKEMQAKYSKLRNTLKTIAEGTEIIHDGKVMQAPMHEWETIKKMRTEIRKNAGAKPSKDYPDKILVDLEKSLGKDIDFSIASWNNPQGARQAYDLMQKANTEEKSTFTLETKRQVYGKAEKGKLDPRESAHTEDTFKPGYTSRSAFQNMRKTQGTDPVAQSKDYFDNFLIRKAFGQAMNKFNPDAMLAELQDINSSSRDAFTAQERNNMIRFARAAKASGFDSEKGTPEEISRARTLNIWRDRAIITGSTGLARMMGVPLVGSGVKVIVGARELMSGVKDSKAVTDIASRLIKIKPDTPEANAGTRLLIKSMAGLPITIVVDGKEKKAKVNKQGTRVTFD